MRRRGSAASRRRARGDIEVDTLSRPRPHPSQPVPDPEPPAFKCHQYISYDDSGSQEHLFVTVPAVVPELDAQSEPFAPDFSFSQKTEDPHSIPVDEFDHERDEHTSQQLELEGLSPLSSVSTSAVIDEDLSNDSIVRKRRRTQADHPLLLWVPYIDTYVEEFLRHEGLGDSIDLKHCAGAFCLSDLEPKYRCRDCQDFRLVCSECLISAHQCLPFHRIESWNGSFFDRTTLKNVGLKVQLGHPDGSKCDLPIPTFDDDFTIIDSDGIHQVSLYFCGCHQSLPHTVQLLRARLFPSTTTAPKSAATFRVLETFQLLSFTSKVSAYEYYKSIERRTDNTGCSSPPDRYPVFLRIVREWRHVRLLKRSGRGHSVSGVKGTAEGECAVLCPACPLPNINLPANWKTEEASKQWLYTLFIAMDANFRLKRMNVSTNQRDPGLNHGYAFVVEETKFKNYLTEYDRRISEEKSNCNNHDAIKSAAMRGGEGTDANGVGTAECARHDMKRPNGVGDLQKGERYVNMDYFVRLSLEHCTPSRLVASYDIGCQWSRNLAKRFDTYPANPISSGDIDVTVLVPKFHLAAHIDKCQTEFSFNYVPGVGRTDGEAPERGWADINAVATSTREMGPGSRRDTLDDHFNDRNWRKISNIASTFVRKSEEAMAGREEHVAAFLEYSIALPPELVKAWTQLCQDWENDRRKPNPFVVPKLHISDKEVRLRLAQEDADALAAGTATMVQEGMTPSILIHQGLEIEDLQRKLCFDTSALSPNATETQRAKILERSTFLRRKFEAWKDDQHLFMPALSLIRSQAELKGSESILAHKLKLYLPSAVLEQMTCNEQLIEAEWQYRYANAGKILNTLRSHLMLHSRLWKSKIQRSNGVHMHTRSLGTIHQVDAKVRYTANHYREVREAMMSLSKHRSDFTWTSLFKPLKDDDLKGLTFMDDVGAEGRKQLTWIWSAQVDGLEIDVDKASHAALRVEWCKSRARAHRWQEECVLLAEEMRRVLAYFKWRAAWWTDQAQEPPIVDNPHRKTHLLPALQALQNEDDRRIIAGKRAYALRQADLQNRLLEFCERKWSGLSEKLLSMADRDATVMVESESL